MKLFVFYNPSTKELITIIEETSQSASQWIKDNALNGVDGFYLTATSSLYEKANSFTDISAFDKLNK